MEIASAVKHLKAFVSKPGTMDFFNKSSCKVMGIFREPFVVVTNYKYTHVQQFVLHELILYCLKKCLTNFTSKYTEVSDALES